MASSGTPKKRDIVAIFTWLAIGTMSVGIIQVGIQIIALATGSESEAGIMLLVLGGLQALVGVAWVIGSVKVRAALRKADAGADAADGAPADADSPDGAGARPE